MMIDDVTSRRLLHLKNLLYAGTVLIQLGFIMIGSYDVRVRVTRPHFFVYICLYYLLVTEYFVRSDFQLPTFQLNEDVAGLCN